MTNPGHVAKLKEGVEAWNRWREAHPDILPDLDNANLRSAHLMGANLDGANLVAALLMGANLDGASLTGAMLDFARLDDASLMGANLGGASLTKARLDRARLDGANLCFANLDEARLDGANLDGTTLRRTVLADIDLSQVVGLDKCIHHGDSYIDHLTLSKSSPLPQDFLRGCGLSDWEIEATKLYQSRLSQQDITDITSRIAELRGEVSEAT